MFAHQSPTKIGSLFSAAWRRIFRHFLFGVSTAIALLIAPTETVADEQLPGVRTSSYMSMSEKERIALVIGASHVLAKWMRKNGEPELNCFYNKGTYSDVVEAVDDYISEVDSAKNQLFSDTLVHALASSCATKLDSYLED